MYCNYEAIMKYFIVFSSSIVDPFSHADLFAMILSTSALYLFGMGIMQPGFQRFNSVPNMDLAQK